MTPAAFLTRRTLLQGLGAGAGFAVARGFGVGHFDRRREPRAAADLTRELAATLTPRQRAQIVFPADHPTRQICNTISVIDRPHLGTLLGPQQVRMVEELTAALLSRRGRADFADTLALEGRLEGCVLALYGDPDTGAAQVVLQGGHIMLRSSAADTAASALGGPVAYGQQTGNGRWRVEGNAFAWHGDAANRLYAALPPDARARAVLPVPPHELVLQVQGAGPALPGAAVGSLPDDARQACEDLIDAVLATWPEADRREARACLDAQGGSDALHFATYASKGFYADMRTLDALPAAERESRGAPYWQVWRLEGPGAVFHFKGHPHVHAYVHIARDPAGSQIGETLGSLDQTLDGARLRPVLEAALRSASGEALAWHGQEIPGRFCAGPVTTGLAYALDPYGNRVVVATLRGRALAAPLRAHLEAHGAPPAPDALVRVATLDYVARREDWLGEPERVEESDVLFRDALVAHLRAEGLRA